MVPTTGRKEAPTGNTTMGFNPLQAVTNRFPQVVGNQVTEAPEVIFDLSQGDKGVEIPPVNDSFKSLPQSTGRRSPAFFQKRLANRKMLKQRVKHYFQ